MKAVTAPDEQENWRRTVAAYRPPDAVMDAQKTIAGMPRVPEFVGDASSIVTEAVQGVTATAIKAPADAVWRERAAIDELILDSAGYGAGGFVNHDALEKFIRAIPGAVASVIPEIAPTVLAAPGVTVDLDWLEKSEALADGAFGSPIPIPDLDIEARVHAIDTHFGRGPIVVHELEPVVVRPTSRRHEVLDLAEITAGEEARSNRIVVETMLLDHDLDYELEHLEFIEVRLVSGTRPDRIHAAMSASHLFEGVANLVFPGQEAKYIDRFGVKRSVGKKDVRNRVSAFIDLHLREELSAHEAKRLQAKIDYAHNWSAEGHHVVYATEAANRAYRDTLEVLAYVARAQERSAR